MQKAFADFGALYADHGGLGPFPLLDESKQKLDYVQPALAAFQLAVQDPADAAAGERKAKAAVWRALGEGSDARLLIPGLGIDVALKKRSIMSSDKLLQGTVDLPGTAAWITGSGWAENVVADHRDQDFGGLLLAQPGTPGYVCFPDGRIIVLKCRSVMDGINLDEKRGKDMPGIEINEKTAETLRRFAALQFPGSIENHGHPFPVHALMEWSVDGRREIPLDAWTPGCVLSHGGEDYATPAALVLAATRDLPPIPFDIRRQDLSSWLLDDCSVDPRSVSAMEDYGHYEPKGFALIRQDLLPLASSLRPGHENELRIQTIPVGNKAPDQNSGKSLADLMSGMLESGSRLLREEIDRFLGDFTRTDIVPVNAAGILRRYAESPGEPFQAWRCIFTTQSSGSFAFSATCMGRVSGDGSPVAAIPSLRLEGLRSGSVKTVSWPFLDDACLSELENSAPRFHEDPLDPFRRILAYARYSVDNGALRRPGAL